MEMRCCNGFVKGGRLSSAPTADTTGYDTPFLGYTVDGKAFLHIGSGKWIALNEDTPPPEESQELHVEK